MGRKNIFFKKGLCMALSASLIIAGFSCVNADAKKKPVLSAKKITLTVGQSRKLKVKNTKKKVKWKSSNKKVVTVSGRGVAVAKGKGTAVITAVISKQKLKCRVTVTLPRESAAPSVAPTVVPSAAPTAAPATTAPAAAPTAAPTQIPTLAPTLEPTLEPTLSPEEQWEIDKVSGTDEAYEKYFKIVSKRYTSLREGATAATVQSIQYPSEVVGENREAYVVLPPNYDPEQTYPVLYMIHGYNCTRDQWKSMSLANIIGNMVYDKEVKPFIAVLPSVVPKGGLVDNNGFTEEKTQAFVTFVEEFKKDLEPYMEANYPISKKREDRGICGLSMGGMEALRIGFGMKDHFDYIGSFSAAPGLETELLTTEGWDKAPETVVVCTGTKDNVVNPESYHQELTRNGVDHIWYLHTGGQHADPVWRTGLVNLLKRSFK